MAPWRRHVDVPALHRLAIVGVVGGQHVATPEDVWKDAEGDLGKVDHDKNCGVEIRGQRRHELRHRLDSAGRAADDDGVDS